MEFYKLKVEKHLSFLPCRDSRSDNCCIFPMNLMQVSLEVYPTMDSTVLVTCLRTAIHRTPPLAPLPGPYLPGAITRGGEGAEADHRGQTRRSDDGPNSKRYMKKNLRTRVYICPTCMSDAADAF